MKFLNKILFKIYNKLRKSYFIGADVSIGKNCKIESAKIRGKVTVAENCKIIDGVEITGIVEIGRFSSINGPNTDIRSALNPVRIGAFTSIARNVTIQEYNHNFDALTTSYFHQNVLGESNLKDLSSKGSIEIGNDVWIGAHSVILSGVKIGNGAIVAANSVVTKDIPEYSIAAGVPALVIGQRFDEDKLFKIKELGDWWELDISIIQNLYKIFENR